MKAHIDKTRAHLGELASLTSKTEAAERRILERAQSRLAEVNAAIERASHGVEGAPDEAQQRYLDLVAERGQLNIVIAKSQSALQQH